MQPTEISNLTIALDIAIIAHAQVFSSDCFLADDDMVPGFQSFTKTAATINNRMGPNDRS